MKTLNEETAKEIGFNLDCLPYWHNYIFLNSRGEWHSTDEEVMDSCDYDIEELDNISVYSYNTLEIPERFEPTGFIGIWEESIFIIERSPEWLKKNDPVMYKALARGREE